LTIPIIEYQLLLSGLVVCYRVALYACSLSILFFIDFLGTAYRLPPSPCRTS
jgi:hypothetical protein